MTSERTVFHPFLDAYLLLCDRRIRKEVLYNLYILHHNISVIIQTQMLPIPKIARWTDCFSEAVLEETLHKILQGNWKSDEQLNIQGELKLIQSITFLEYKQASFSSTFFSFSSPYIMIVRASALSQILTSLNSTTYPLNSFRTQ